MGYRGYVGLYRDMRENQMEKKRENEMETVIIHEVVGVDMSH